MLSKDPTIQVILKLMEGMQEIQKKMVRNGGEESALEPEVVRHSADLPRLADWSPDTAPIDYNDWVLRWRICHQQVSSGGQSLLRLPVNGMNNTSSYHQLHV